MRHFTCLADLGPDGVHAVLDQAIAWKRCPPEAHLAGKILGMVFFNPSLRTRASFEAVMARGGGHAIVLEVGGGVWKLEDRIGAVMDQDRAEHVREAVPVLGRYVDLLAVRTFASCTNDDDDERDPVMRAFADYSTVPVISMESAREHPCQGLADVLTIAETFGETRGLPVTLTWAPHVKPLPKAVPHSFLLTAGAAGCRVRVAHPPGFELHPAVVSEAREFARASGGEVTFTSDQDEALEGSRVVYAKAWGPAAPGPLGPEAVRAFPSWRIEARQLARAASDAIFLHCLPVRRNVEVGDAVLDSPASRVIDEAENRFHVQRMLLDWLAR
ncbi:MAG TPA: N-acetylornithine carbamoyltransferase [Vicinamibacterales bacterium]|nr:N-acetylornithine carbamoyltransferase [Acidobacteriota bacterium]HOC19405.1 N-acetylornithine carbamoyltransferase [Vicinamibacterales bacterium]